MRIGWASDAGYQRAIRVDRRNLQEVPRERPRRWKPRASARGKKSRAQRLPWFGHPAWQNWHANATELPLSAFARPRQFSNAIAGPTTTPSTLAALPLSRIHALLAFAAGIAGIFVDSLLGSIPERRGWLNNDAVNALSTLAAAVLGAWLTQVM